MRILNRKARALKGKAYALLKSDSGSTKIVIIILVIVVVIILLAVIFRNQIKVSIDRILAKADKPVIYLYPEEKTDVSVTLGVTPDISYPKYNDGWNVTAYPDGTITDSFGNEYSYLFWEKYSDVKWDFGEGFCVAGTDTAEFLRWALSEQGLTPKEYNEFIVYWLPKMQNNAYNIISFQKEVYENFAPLEIAPAPDVVKRVFMAYYPSDTEVDIPEQELSSFKRTGFTVVEWGGILVSQ